MIALPAPAPHVLDVAVARFVENRLDGMPLDEAVREYDADAALLLAPLPGLEP